jgi:hypothetical protein
VTHATLSKRSSQPSSKKQVDGAHSAAALRIGEPDDALEHEADHIADEVIPGGRMKRHWSISNIGVGAPLQRECGCGGASTASGECEECKKKDEKTLPRKASGPAQVGVAPLIIHEALNSPGQPLGGTTRDSFDIDRGPDTGVSAMKELLESDQYGGRLKQIRQTLGG